MIHKKIGVLYQATLLALTATLLLGLGCGPNASSARERPIPVEGVDPELSGRSTARSTQPIPPPTGGDVQAAVQRVFGSDVRIAEDPGGFLAGDFNGDDAQDLAVVVLPSEAKLAELNDSLANWSVQDPRHAYVPPTNTSVLVPPSIPKAQKIHLGEKLLAVIHGFGPAGWRDPMARQAYLLRGAAGSSIRVSEPSTLLIHDFGVFPSRRDVIAERLGESVGVVYWTGATYAWHAER